MRVKQNPRNVLKRYSQVIHNVQKVNPFGSTIVIIKR